MPLPTLATYPLSALRHDGRRAPEHRHAHASISTNPTADGSSYLSVGQTKVHCTVTGPAELRGLSHGGGGSKDTASVVVEITATESAGGGRGGRLDRRLQQTYPPLLSTTFTTALLPLPASSTILISLHVLENDGALLACLINASTLALIDAGVPMRGGLVGCGVGLLSASLSAGGGGAGGGRTGGKGKGTILVDPNEAEERECVGMTVAVRGGGVGGEEEGEGEGRVVVCEMEGKVGVGDVEGLVKGGVDACRGVRGWLDGVVRGGQGGWGGVGWGLMRDR